MVAGPICIKTVASMSGSMARIKCVSRQVALLHFFIQKKNEDYDFTAFARRL